MESFKEQSFWTPARMALTVAALALLSTLGISGCNSAPGGNTPNATMTVNGANSNAPAKSNAEAPPMSVPLPDIALNTELKAIDGNAFKVSDLKGKVLLIDLWATWCGPCRYEVPELVKFQNEYGPRGFEVVGLDIDPGSDTEEDVRAFMKEYGINYKVAFVEQDLARSLMKGNNIPQSLIVSRDGKIMKHFIGYNQARTPALMREAIEQAFK